MKTGLILTLLLFKVIFKIILRPTLKYLPKSIDRVPRGMLTIPSLICP
jgi:hypothetical protein